MAKNEISEAEIREYILGQSRNDKTDRLDELSFSDGYSERIGAVERDLIDDYLAGLLTSDQKNAFEAHYLSTPVRRDKVEFAKAFAAYARHSRPIEVEGEASPSIFDVFRQWRFVVQFGAVAGLLLMGIVGWIIFGKTSSPEIAVVDNIGVAPQQAANREVSTVPPSPEPSISASSIPSPVQSPVAPVRQEGTPKPQPTPPSSRQQPSSLAVFVLTPALRGSSFKTLEIPEDAVTAEFRLQLETEASGPFSVEIHDVRGSQNVWSARNLKPGGRGVTRSLNFRTPTRIVRNGEYRVSVFVAGEDTGSENVGEYFFRAAP